MKITKDHIFAGIVVILVICVSAYLGILIGRDKFDYKTIAEGIVMTNEEKNYKSVLITDYVEYTNLLKQYGINESAFLTSGDLDEKDYIVDFIFYNDDLEIKGIDLEITDNGTNITYNVNEEVKNSKEILIYFIPIKKNSLSEYKLANRYFKVK